MFINNHCSFCYKKKFVKYVVVHYFKPHRRKNSTHITGELCNESNHLKNTAKNMMNGL